MNDEQTYENYIEAAKANARRKRNGVSSYESADGTTITAHKDGRVEIVKRETKWFRSLKRI